MSLRAATWGKSPERRSGTASQPEHMGLEVTLGGEAASKVVMNLTITHENNARPEARVTRRQAHVDTIRANLFEASAEVLVSNQSR